MHILLIPSWYPKNSQDIPGCFFREQAIALAHSGHKVGVLSLNGHSKGRFTTPNLWKGLSEIEVDEGVETWRIHHVAGIRGYARIALPFLVHKFFKEYCFHLGTPDIIHAHSGFDGGVWARLIGKHHNIPYAVTEHSTAFPMKLIPCRYIKKAKIVFEDALAVIAVSSMLANCIQATCSIAKPILTIPNILDQTNFNCKCLFTKSYKDFTFLNVGLLTKKKGQDYLIKAFAEKFRNRPVKLLIGGNGEERTALEHLIEKLNMRKQIQLLGMLTRQEVQEKMMKCDVFVLSSLFETFGVVLIEALSCGKPVIATKCGGPEDIVNNFNGVLVEKGSIEELSAAMEDVYKNYGRYNNKEIHEDCIKRFGREAITTKLTHIYENILGRNDEAVLD